jgi:hypothetical protein
MAPDETDSGPAAEDRPVCPHCGHENIPGAAFCARCGQSLDDNAPPAEVIDVEPTDSQATSAYAPVTSTVTAPSASPWARPDALDTDPGQTTALPAYVPISDVAAAPVVRQPRGARGFVLGVIAVLLILAVLALYIYAAWLSDSARSTVDGWLPWM